MARTIRLLDDQASFERLGLDRSRPAHWEDALRMKLPLNPGEWEWWYCDAHFTNGDYCMASFNINTDAGGQLAPLIGLNIVRAGKTLCDIYIPFEAAQLQASDTHCAVTLGNSFLRSVDGLDRYHVYVDPSQNRGFGMDLVFERTVPPYRPGTGRWDDGRNHFSWFCPVPGARVEGKLLIDGESVNVTGNGYHDHNWGDVPMDRLLDSWLWGRADVDGISVVAAATRFKADCGGTETPQLYVARGNEVLLNAFSSELVCLDGVKVAHPETGKMISSDCIYLVDREDQHGQVRFRANGAAVAWFRVFRTSGDWETWYARYPAEVTIEVATHSGVVQAAGGGTLENMDFFGRRVSPAGQTPPSS